MLGPRALAQQAPPSTAAPSTTTSPTQKNIEAYLRHLYAFGPDVLLVVGPPKSTPVEGLLETTVDVTIGGNKKTVKFYRNKDGKFLFRGEVSDLSKDTLAENRAQISIDRTPA